MKLYEMENGNEIGYCERLAGIWICLDCALENETENYEDNDDWETIYNDYPELALGDINYEHICSECKKIFIGNIR